MWSQMLRRPHGDRAIHEIENRKVTARRPRSDRKTSVRHPHGCCSHHKFALRLPWGCRGPPQGRREAAVRFYSHPRQGKNRVTSWPSWGHCTGTLRCGCGVATLGFLKKFNVKFEKTASLAMTLGSPYGLHKNRKAAVRFGGLRSLYGRRNHTANYMWPWHNYASYNRVKLHSQGINMIYLVNAMTQWWYNIPQELIH